MAVRAAGAAPRRHRRRRPGGESGLLRHRRHPGAGADRCRRPGRAGPGGGRQVWRVRRRQDADRAQQLLCGGRGHRPLPAGGPPSPARDRGPALRGRWRPGLGHVHAAPRTVHAGPAGHRLRAAAPGRRPGGGAGGAARLLPGRAVRPAGGRRAHAGAAWQQPLSAAGLGRPGARPRDRGRRHRQPGQGRGRPGRPERQPDAGPGRDAGAAGRAGMAVGACSPAGFAAGIAACGMKRSGKPDLTLLVSDRPATAAGVFTTNRVVAAPITVSRAQIQDGLARAIVTNSGSANACTGTAGRDNAWTMVAEVGVALGIPASHVLVASTGVIGTQLPIDDVVAGIRSAAGSLAGTNGRQSADAIRTTDRYPKLAQSQVELAGGPVRIGGMAKGAGMVRPNMATTLAQVTLDAELPQAGLRRILRNAVADSFNAISVDGCTSTNDCVFMLANGASGVAVDGPRQLRVLSGAVSELMLDLAKQVVRDGEGSTRVCIYTVTGALSAPEARAAARGVAENTLVKCALHGGDPNWGRILAALGAAGVHLDPDRVSVAVGGVPIVAAGSGIDGMVARARQQVSKDEVEVDISLGLGEGSATVIASDLSPGYVRFNSASTT